MWIIIIDMLLTLYALIAIWTQTLDGYDDSTGRCMRADGQERSINDYETYKINSPIRCQGHEICKTNCDLDVNCKGYEFIENIGKAIINQCTHWTVDVKGDGTDRYDCSSKHGGKRVFCFTKWGNIAPFMVE